MLSLLHYHHHYFIPLNVLVSLRKIHTICRSNNFVPLFVEGKSDARVISVLIEHIKYLGWLRQQHQVSSVLVGQILKIHILINIILC